MSTSDFGASHDSSELLALDQTIREVSMAISVAEARAIRLLKTAFSNPDKAEQGLRSVMLDTRSIEAAIEIIQQNSWKRSRLFGQTREGWLFFGQRRAAGEALAELPEALRDLDQLNKKRRDLIDGRQLHMASQAASVDDPLQLRWRTASKQSRGMRMK